MTLPDQDRLATMLEDVVHDGAVGAALHALWAACERAGQREAFVDAVQEMTGASVPVSRVSPPAQLPFFPETSS